MRNRPAQPYFAESSCKNTWAKKVRTEKIDTCLNQLYEVTNGEQWERILKWSRKSANKVANSIKAKQISKFNKLYYSKFGRGLDPEKVVRSYMYSSMQNAHHR